MTHNNTALTVESFWHYSVTTYQRGDIAPIALTLQDLYGVNVNLLLLLCWCLEHGVIIDLKQFRHIADVVCANSDALVAHRHKRQAAKPTAGTSSDEYETLKQQELVLEREQQALLVQTANQCQLTKLAGQGSTMLNASIAAFINLYQLKDQKDARALLTLLLKQLP